MSFVGPFDLLGNIFLKCCAKLMIYFEISLRRIYPQKATTPLFSLCLHQNLIAKKRFSWQHDRAQDKLGSCKWLTFPVHDCLSRIKNIFLISYFKLTSWLWSVIWTRNLWLLRSTTLSYFLEMYKKLLHSNYSSQETGQNKIIVVTEAINNSCSCGRISKYKTVFKIRLLIISLRWDWTRVYISEPYCSGYHQSRTQCFRILWNWICDPSKCSRWKYFDDITSWTLVHQNFSDISILGTYDAPNTNRNSRASQSLIVIVASPPSNPNYTKFHRAVNYYNEISPFNFPNPLPWPKSVSQKVLPSLGSKMYKANNCTSQLNVISFSFTFQCLQITVYAAYLYDAVMLYAKALDATLKENGSATDGVAIFNKLNGTFYRSKLKPTFFYFEIFTYNWHLFFFDDNPRGLLNSEIALLYCFNRHPSEVTVSEIAFFCVGK